MSTRLSNRLERRLSELHDPGLDGLLSTLRSPLRFDSQEMLAAHLVEGALLNVTRLASDCLSIPSGEYVVWVTDSGRTVLHPSKIRDAEIHRTQSEDSYELHTARLLGVWNKLERSILEDAAPGQPSRQSSQSHVGNHFAQAPEQAPDAPYTFGKKVTRTSLWSAMQQSGMGVDDLARAVGVDKSTISRLLRDVQQGPGDPGGRNPSVGLAHKIAQVLGVDVGEVLPPPDDVKIHKRKATSGSGRQGTATNSTNGNSSFGQGGPAPAPSESLVRQAAALMVECKIEPTQFLVEQLIGLPNSDQLINEFLGKMFGKKSANSPAAAPQGSENTTVGTGKRTDGTSKFVSEASRSITEASLQLMELQSLFQKYPFTASFGGQKFTLDQWLGGIISSLRKVKHNLPEAVLKAKARQQPGGVDTKSTTTPA